jgi:hypothetical protein
MNYQPGTDSKPVAGKEAEKLATALVTGGHVANETALATVARITEKRNPKLTGRERIFRALEAKGYCRAHVSIEHEPVQYYAEGREGGWEIELDDEALALDPSWGQEVPPPKPGENDVYEVGYGYLSAFSLRVMLEVISQLNPAAANPELALPE